MSNGLSLDFNRYKPKQNYTFEVEIAEARTGGKTYPRLSSAVTSVSLVKVPIQTIQDEPQGFGQYWNIIPVHDVDSKEMKITFEETDDMLVTSLFAPKVGQGNTYKDLWRGGEFIITITYYNEYKYDIDKHRASEHVERYLAIVKDFQHPTFQRTGNVDKLDITVTFKVMLADNEISNGIILEGDHLNYINKIQERIKALFKLFYGREKIDEEIPATPAAPSTPATPATPATPTEGGETKTPTEEEVKEAKEAEAKKEADNDPNTGSGRANKAIPKLKRLTTNTNIANKHLSKDSYVGTGDSLAAYYPTIFKAYNEWLSANGLSANLKNARKFLTESGVLSTSHDSYNGACAAGTNLQILLASGSSSYGTLGNGKAVASNYAKTHGTESQTFDMNNCDWNTVNKKLKELGADGGEYIVSVTYGDDKGTDKDYGHAYTMTDGITMSDYQQKSLSGMANNAHGGCASLTITRIA